MKSAIFAAILAGTALVAGGAAAHHSFAMYDREKVVTLSGTVKQFSWNSPHIRIEILTDTGLMTWDIEGSSPVVLSRGGWTNTVIKPGDRVSIGIHPRKDGRTSGLLADELQILVNGHAPPGVLYLHTLNTGS